MMIAVPDAVTAAEVAAAAEAAARRRPLPAAGRVRLERFDEGLAAQIMHVGPYSDGGADDRALHAFVAEQGYELRGRHHEIYLGDPRRTAPERLKTVIRHPVRASHAAPGRAARARAPYLRQLQREPAPRTAPGTRGRARGCARRRCGSASVTSS